MTSEPPQSERKQLFAHQRAVVDKMLIGEPFGIFAEMGTGKTMMALDAVHKMLISGLIEDTLIIVPSPLVANWHKSIENIIEFEGYTDFDVDLLKSAITIISYRMTWTKRINRYRVQLRDIVDRPWGAVIIDESHRLGSHNSCQTQACLQIARNSTYRYIMTGTPDSTQYIKLYGQMMFLYPNLWRTHGEFKKNAIIKYDFFRNPKKYNVDYCEGLKRQFGHVIRLKDCVDLPPTSEETVTLNLASTKEYRDILLGRYERYGITLMGSGTGYNKLLQISSGHLKTDEEILDLKTEKLDALMETVDGTDDKVVIFAKYRRSIEQICERLTKEHIKHHRFDGTEPKPVWQDFQTDDSKAIVVQYQRGGIGIDLYASHTCVFYEPTFSAVDLEQAKARIHRIGQEQHCLYYYYTASEIEARAWDTVRRGVDVSSDLLDEWAEDEKQRIKPNRRKS